MLEPGVAWALRSCWEECDDKAGTLASLGGNPHSELRKPRKPYLSEPRFGPSSGCHIRGTTRAVDVPCPGTAAPPPPDSLTAPLVLWHVPPSSPPGRLPSPLYCCSSVSPRKLVASGKTGVCGGHYSGRRCVNVC
ncbi:hypothetical protein CapIbe_006120 [Capra ibex]